MNIQSEFLQGLQKKKKKKKKKTKKKKKKKKKNPNKELKGEDKLGGWD